MFEKHDNSDAYKVWLSQNEADELLQEASDTQHRLTFELGVRCGLRSEEITRVCPNDIKSTQAGYMLRVESAKKDDVRQVPIPETLAIRIESVDSVRRHDSDEPIIQSSKRSIRRWMDQTTERLAEKHSDEMWREVTTHDLRRTWATALKSNTDDEIDSLLVLDWGGWASLEVFLDTYRGAFSPEKQKEARESVDWL